MIKTSAELADRLAALEAAKGQDYADLHARFIEDITPVMDNLDSTNRQAIDLAMGWADPVPGRQIEYDEQDDFCKSLLAVLALVKSGVPTNMTGNIIAVRGRRNKIAMRAYYEAVTYFMTGHHGTLNESGIS